MVSSTESTTITGSRYIRGDKFGDFKRNTRRYGTLLPAQIAQGPTFVYAAEEDEDDSGTYTDSESSWEFTPASPSTRKSKISGITQTSVAQNIAKNSTGTTEAQKIVHDYLKKRNGNIEVKSSTVVRTTKELPMIPDRTSSYTLANTDDGKSTIDLEKRPEPAIRLFHHDRAGLAQAVSIAIRFSCCFILIFAQQHQGMEMIQAGRSTFGESIRCQRPGCTDVLPDIEALKFHLHVHNIGDSLDVMSTIPAYSGQTEEPRNTPIESPLRKEPARKVHTRSKSSVEIEVTPRQPRSTHRAGKSDMKNSSSLPDSRNHSATHISASTSHTRTKIPPQSRGRRSYRGTFRNELSEAGYNDTITTVLSRPTSPVPTFQEILHPKKDPPLNFVDHNDSFSSPAGPGRGEKEFSRNTSPKRAFSPARALSPIRGMSDS